MYKSKKIVATIEARMTSSRLPGKVLMKFCEKTVLQHIIERLRRSRYVDTVVVATTTNRTDDPVVELCRSMDCLFYRGSEDDVLLRVLEATQSVNADIIVETTGDNPMIDWRHVDKVIEAFFSGEYDYASNALEKGFPIGFNVQVFPVSVLREVNEITNEPEDHEHVSLYIYTNPNKYRLCSVSAEGILYRPDIEVTLDTAEDYNLLNKIYEALYPNNNDFTAENVINLITDNPHLLDIISNTVRKHPKTEV